MPPTPPGPNSGKSVSLLLIGTVVGAVLAFLFITVVLVGVLWWGGFFTRKNVASPAVTPNVAPPQRVERMVRAAPPPVRDFEVTVDARPERTTLASPGDVAPVLHIRSQSLNVLDGKPLVIETATKVQQADGYLIVRDSQNLRI